MKRVTEANLSGEGGAFSLIFNVQKNLYNRNKRDVIFDYFSMGVFPNDLTVEEICRMGGNVYEADLRHNRALGFLKLPKIFYRYCKDNDVEIVHVHGESAFILFLYSLSAKMAGVKNIILHSHCSDMNGDYRTIKKMVHYLLRPWLGFVATRFLSCSDLATNWMYIGRKKEKSVFIKNGVHINDFKYDKGKRKKYRKKYGIEDKTIALVSLGDMGYQKNPFFMCDVMKKLDSSYKLYFIGNGVKADSVKEYVVKNDLENKVVFLGYQKAADVLNAMDIFVMPSRFEGLPVSGVEAQVNGLPCVFASTITKQVKILDRVYFEEINSTGKWADLIRSIDMAHDIREKAFEKVKMSGFDINDTADSIYNIYEEM